MLSASDLIKQSWQDYTQRWHDWTIFSLLIFLPTFILTVVGSFGIYLSLYVPSTVYLTNVLILILSLVALIFGFWTSISLLHAGGEFITNGKVDSWKDHYTATAGLLWAGIFTSIIVALAVLVGTILLVVPGIIFLVWFYFALYEVVLDGKRGWSAMKESRNLVRGRWWGVLWRILAPNFVFGAAVLLAQYVLFAIIEPLPLSIEAITLIENILSAILSAVVAPLTMLAMTRLYFALKQDFVPAPNGEPAAPTAQ